MINRITQSLLRRLAYSVPADTDSGPFFTGLGKDRENVISQYVYIDEIHPEAISIGDTHHNRYWDLHNCPFLLGPQKKISNQK